MHTEQFVQDLLCQPERIQRVLKQLNEQDWHFVTAAENGCTDVLNQEVNFEHGRLDILATFNGRTRLVIIEVKAGDAGIDAVEQLKSYLGDWPDLQKSLQLPDLAPEQIRGLVLAEGFTGITELPPRISLVQFQWNGNRWPFTIIQPQPQAEPAEEVTVKAAKRSGLYTVADHSSRILDEELRNFYCAIANCFLDPTEARFSWVFQNPKGSHLAIHYKGIYIAHLWAKRRSFRVGFGRYESEFDQTISRSNLPEHGEFITRNIGALLNRIDEEKSAIPLGFSWQDCLD